MSGCSAGTAQYYSFMRSDPDPVSTLAGLDQFLQNAGRGRKKFLCTSVQIEF